MDERGRTDGRTDGRLLPLLHLLPMRGGERGGVHFLAVFDAAAAAAIDSNCEFAPA